MPKSQLTSNPFYVALVLVGIAFCLTASAYGVLIYREMHGPVDAPADASSLLRWMGLHGEKMLVGEVLLMALTTFGAIKTDHYWQARRDQALDR